MMNSLFKIRYVPEVYGNVMAFTDKQSHKQRETLMMEDKNRVVYAACIFRKRWKDIEKFDDYKHNNTEGSWIITMYATPKFHKRFKAMLANPEKFIKNIERWKKRYHRMAKRNKIVREDSED